MRPRALDARARAHDREGVVVAEIMAAVTWRRWPGRPLRVWDSSLGCNVRKLVGYVGCYPMPLNLSTGLRERLVSTRHVAPRAIKTVGDRPLNLAMIFDHGESTLSQRGLLFRAPIEQSDLEWSA